MEYEVIEGEINVEPNKPLEEIIDSPKDKKSKVHTYVLILSNYTNLSVYMFYYKLLDKDGDMLIPINIPDSGYYRYHLIYLHDKDKSGLYKSECVFNLLKGYYSDSGMKYLSKSVLKEHLEDIIDYCERVQRSYM